uniref:Uncharacterized protein n=1 Tax=Glossina austeni TaxID=7395 RepID=A0A1A9UHM3_GLOAU
MPASATINSNAPATADTIATSITCVTSATTANTATATVAGTPATIMNANKHKTKDPYETVIAATLDELWQIFVTKS